MNDLSDRIRNIRTVFVNRRQAAAILQAFYNHDTTRNRIDEMNEFILNGGVTYNSNQELVLDTARIRDRQIRWKIINDLQIFLRRNRIDNHVLVYILGHYVALHRITSQDDYVLVLRHPVEQIYLRDGIIPVIQTFYVLINRRDRERY